MVQHRTSPFTAENNASGIPLISSQSIFAMSDGAPPPYFTSFPNGAKDREANLKHCRPMGIPTIVMHHKSPAKHHNKACHIPPHNIQTMLPKQPMSYTSLYLYLNLVIHLCSTACRCVSCNTVYSKGDAQAKQFVMVVRYIKLVEVAP